MGALEYLKDAGRLIRTLRHLRPLQVRWRARSVARRVLWRLEPARLSAQLESEGGALSPFLWHSPLLPEFARLRKGRAALRPSQAQAVLENRFQLSNLAFSFEGSVDWHRDDVRSGNALAGFELHYQEYLEDLALAYQAEPDAAFLRKWEELVCSWIERNPPAGRDFARFSWSPYVIAERVRNWISSSYWLTEQLGDHVRRDFETSLLRQVAFLAANLEHDLQGNHLLQNLCGLAVGLCFLGGRRAAAMRRTALPQLLRVAEQQVLADGMHEERSFSYHLKAALDLLEVLALLRGGAFADRSRDGRELEGRLNELVRRMLGAVAATADAVGELPLLNDSQEVRREMIAWAIANAPGGRPLVLPSTRQRLEGSGCLVGRQGPWAAAFDVGAGGPQHQMGHAHADGLTFELWHQGRKLVCDSGNATYQVGEKRLWYRGAAAHNTVRADGQDSMEVWRSFRVGRRPRHCVGQVLQEDGGLTRWYGEHDGYAHLRGHPVHRRWFAMGEQVVQAHDRVEGGAEHLIESYLHFHPDVTIEAAASPAFSLKDLEAFAGALPGSVLADELSSSAWLWRTGDTSDAAAQGCVIAYWPSRLSMAVERRDCTYAPALNVERPAACLRLGGRCRLPLECGWLIVSGLSLRRGPQGGG